MLSPILRHCAARLNSGVRPLHNHPVDRPLEPLPWGMKAVVAYFFAASLASVAYQALQDHSGLSRSGLLGLLTGHILLQMPRVVTGIGLARQKRWAQYAGGILLAFATPISALEFNRGVLEVIPDSALSQTLTLLSIPVSVVWHGFWGYLIYRYRPTPTAPASARA